jgi:hypothetical protein
MAFAPNVPLKSRGRFAPRAMRMARSRITLRSIRTTVADGLVAFGSGKRLICMDGRDVDDALDRQIPLKGRSRTQVRRAAETGRHGTGPRLSGHPHPRHRHRRAAGYRHLPHRRYGRAPDDRHRRAGAKSSVETLKKARWEARSETMRRDPNLPARSRIRPGDS